MLKEGLTLVVSKVVFVKSSPTKPWNKKPYMKLSYGTVCSYRYLLISPMHLSTLSSTLRSNVFTQQLATWRACSKDLSRSINGQ